MKRFLFSILLCAMLSGCGSDDGAGGDRAGDAAADVGDASADASPSDGARGDGAASDATLDTGAVDTGAVDAATSDTGAGDTGATDTGATDTGATDTGASDTGASDTGASDTGASDAGAVDAAPPDAGWTGTAHVHISISNSCKIVATDPVSFDVPAGKTLKLSWHNHSVDYRADVWASYGGGYLGLEPSATWNEPYEHCFIKSTHLEYVDVSPEGSPSGCGKVRVNIQCHAP